MQAFGIQQLPWLDAPFERFINERQSGHSAHAQLVSIDQGLGGHILANEMAEAAMCTALTPVGACGQCKSCLLFKAGTHPDCHVIKADGTIIKVDQIRDLCQKLTVTAQQGGQRVAIILNCEQFNLASANALLKTLEEPGNNILIILQTDVPSRILATIKSRCQQVAFHAPDRKQVYEWLKAHQMLPSVRAGEKPHDVTWCLSMIGGPLKLAESLSSQHYQQLIQFRTDWALSIKSGHLNGSLIKVSEHQIVDALNVLYLYLRQYVLKSKELDALAISNIIGLSSKVAQICQRLATMASVNAPALCQDYILEFRQLIHIK
ncbi:DNA polymerase III subunit delta' [Shewanella electrodiphila]|uniref:DNA-directed DNA polymerase n=1 Tax=Shewanella electrodiphila TaxID=934143 RepID=A0ABT0KN29_9GAMM|nr:DNA polymerase III subunit delta' [Shewanella electrodiphila]MCL1045184.1 DNA polymerase III subunit delta' [Shewanella electrodiphila]